MTDSNDKKLQKFLDNISKALVQLEGFEIGQLDKRIDGLKEILRDFSRYIIRSGLVGITSSGKSSLLNVLLGIEEKMLKEQSKATTNMIVFCAKADEPQVEIHFENKKTLKKTGKDVKPSFLWKYTSEDENPQNKYEVKFIRLSLPTFLLGDDLELADTPGLDAYGLKEHEDLTLREFLPQADLIIYLSSIGSPMKGTDRRTLNQIMDADQRVIFVQTCKGSVVEQASGNGLTISVNEQLDSYKEDFAKTIEAYPKLKDAPIVQVETTIAKDYLKDKNLTAWQESGLDEFEHAVKHVTGQLRTTNTLRNLRMAVVGTTALSGLIKSIVKAEREKEGFLEEKTKYLEKARRDLREVIRDRDEVLFKAFEKINPTVLFKQYSAELSEVFTQRYDYNPIHDKEFIAKAHAIGERIKGIKAEVLESLDAAKDRYREFFRELQLDVKRADIQNVIQKEFSLPNAQKKRVAEALSQAEDPTKLGSLKGPQKIKDEYKGITDEYIDKHKYIEDIGKSLTLYFEPLDNHLQWWEKTINASYIEPLQRKIDGFEDDIRTINEGLSYQESQYEKLVAISNDLDKWSGEITDAYSSENILEYKGPIYKGAQKAISAWIKSDNTSLLLQLGTRLFQNMFQLYYSKCLKAISVKPQKNIVIIGNEYGSLIKFIRLLLRLSPEKHAQLLEGKTPLSINLQARDTGIRNIDITDEAGDSGHSFYLLGNDSRSFDSARANKLLEKADVIQIMVDDLHRVASALSDLVERNLFYKMVEQQKDKVVFAYPSAAHFQKERLNILFSEAMAEVNKVFGSSVPLYSSSDRTHWFIYENFEIRYNYFNEFAEKIMHENFKTDKCIRDWKFQGIPLDEPFTEKILREQFDRVMLER